MVMPNVWLPAPNFQGSSNDPAPIVPPNLANTLIPFAIASVAATLGTAPANIGWGSGTIQGSSRFTIAPGLNGVQVPAPGIYLVTININAPGSAAGDGFLMNGTLNGTQAFGQSFSASMSVAQPQQYTITTLSRVTTPTGVFNLSAACSVASTAVTVSISVALIGLISPT